MRTLTPLLVVLLVACARAGSPAAGPPRDGGDSGGPLLPEQAAYDVLHYALTLAVDPDERAIEGSLTVRARALEPLERFVLDLDGRLQVRGVTGGDGALPFEHRDGRIWIELPAPAPVGAQLELTVDYGGRPRVAPRPPWDGGLSWERTEDGEPWIATSCQGQGADLWWPCKDHPSDKPEGMDLVITVPRGLFCASNGVLVSDQETAAGRRLHWQVRSPISNYAVALNIAPYETLEHRFESVSGEAFPVTFWVLPENLEEAREVFPEFLDHLRFFEELLGPYPFRAEKYGIAETPHLGMEHQTVIAYGNEYRRDRFDYDSLHHHELAHEWFANLVTCRDWKDMWLHEGFGTYMQALYVERNHGPEAYRTHMQSTRRGLRNRRPVAPRETRSAGQIYFGGAAGFDNDIYNKGACVLHTLRWLLGDETFFTFLRRMAYPDPALERVTDGSQVRLVDTEDCRRLAESIAERDLAWFFEVYLRQPRLPELKAVRRVDALELSWEVPVEVEFPLPVPVRVGRGDDAVMHRVEMPAGRGSLSLPPGTAYAVDPDRWLLRD